MSRISANNSTDQTFDSPLPNGWRIARLDDVCKPRLEKALEGERPYVEIGDIDIDSKSYVRSEKAAVKGAIIAEAGDILVSRVRPTRGAITLLREARVTVSSALSVFTPTEDILPAYVFHALAWNRQFAIYLGDRCTGTMYPTVSRDVVSSYRIAVAPLPEQRRIVAEIEKQFTRLDAGIAALRRTQSNLKRYRASILKAACEGQLVGHTLDGQIPASWRRDQLGNIVSFAQGIQVGLPDQIDTPASGYVRFIRITNYTQNDDRFTFVPDPGAKYFVDENEVVMVRYQIFHDVPAQGATKAFNIDHVAVGPAGVVVIEVKTRRKGNTRPGFKEHVVVFDGLKCIWPWGEDRHGPEQALKEAEWLKRFLFERLGLDTPVRAVLALPGWWVEEKVRGPVAVVNSKNVAYAVEGRGPQILSDKEIDLIARQLDTLCRDVED